MTAGRKVAVVEEGDQTEITCRTTKPIAICIFIAPSGAIFDTKASIEEGERINYINSDTDCGIKISNVRNYDAGDWRLCLSLF